MSSDVRNWLTANLKPLLPNKWKWEPYQRDVGTLATTTVWWKQERIVRFAEAPIGTVRVEGTVTVASALTDVAKSEEDLDQAVTAVCQAIDGLDGLAWTEAQKVAVDNSYFGWDISVWTTATKTP